VAPEPEETKPEEPQVAPENDGEPEETKPEDPPEVEPDEEPGEADVYPDPTMDMSKTELRKIADAYRIEYKPQTTKKELVDLITAAMYPADEAE
jgi:hypothetical protein